MGLISKIEDKLSGSSQNKLEKQSQDTDDPSHLRHPISSAQGSSPTGTAVSAPSDSNDGRWTESGAYSSSKTDRMPASDVRRDGYGTVPYNTGTTDRMTTSDVRRDEYTGTGTVPYDSSTTHRMPGNDVRSIAYDETSPTTSSGPRQPFHPYSRKGQQTAAGASTGYSSSRTADFGSRSAEDPSVGRSKQGGILNQTDEPHYSSTHQDPGYMPTGGSHQIGTASTVPYPSHSTTEHHYGRDAAIAGGAGAGGVGAYEMASAPKESADQAQARKVGQAYEAGYRDAMEHMRAEMQR